MKNIIYIKKLDFLNLLLIKLKYKNNYKIFTLENNSILTKFFCILFNLQSYVIDYNMGNNLINKKKYHFWSLQHDISNRLSDFIYNKHKKNINYLNSINKNINNEKKKAIIKKDIDIENRNLILLYLLSIKESNLDYYNSYIFDNSNFIDDIGNFFKKENIKFVKKIEFIILKRQFLLFFLLFIHFTFFIPSFILSIFIKKNKSYKIASKFEKGLLKQYFPDFIWIKNLKEYDGKLLLYNDEIMNTENAILNSIE